MSRELDIDSKTELWIPAFNAIRQNKDTICPRCGAYKLDVTVKKTNGDIGYVLITCNDCGKSGYFSRVDFGNRERIKDHIDQPTLATAT